MKAAVVSTPPPKRRGRKTNAERGLGGPMIKVGIALTPEQHAYMADRAQRLDKSIPELIRDMIARRLAKQGK